MYCWSHFTSYRFESQILMENRKFCLPHLHSKDIQSRILTYNCQNIAITFGMEKLEWCGYPMAEKVWRHVYSFWQNTEMWWTDGCLQTDRRHLTAYAVLMHSITRQKWHIFTSVKVANKKGLTQEHLSTSQHAAPTNIGLEPWVGKGGQVCTIREPYPRLEVQLEVIKTCRDRISVFLFDIAFCINAVLHIVMQFNIKNSLPQWRYW